MICGSSPGHILIALIAARSNVRLPFGHLKYIKNVNAYVTNIEKPLIRPSLMERKSRVQNAPDRNVLPRRITQLQPETL